MPFLKHILNHKLFSRAGRRREGVHSVRIAFLGHFGKGNLGNEATLQAILYHLRKKLPDADFTCICTGPAATAETHNIATHPMNPILIGEWRLQNALIKTLRRIVFGFPSEVYRWLDSFRLIGEADVLIIPGTGLLTDAYGARGWGPYSTFRWSLVARIRGCKLLILSVGAGPIYSWTSRLLVKSVLALADFRSYRDDTSLHYLTHIGFAPTNNNVAGNVACNDRVCPDLAFSLPHNVVQPDGGQKRPRAVVGLGVMEYAGRYSVATPNHDAYCNYLNNLVMFARWLLARGYDIRILIGDYSDTTVAREFRTLLKGLSLYDSTRIVDEPATSVKQLLSQLADTDMVVATRFHNVLLALLLNKPVISISFHHKCTSLMDTMGLANYCQDINKFRVDRLIDQFCALEANAERIGPLIKEKTDGFRRVLDQQYECIVSYI